LCAWLSAAVGLGLILNAILGWSWADPVAGLVIAAVAAREAVRAWRGEGCCAPGRPGGHAHDAEDADGCGTEWTDGCCAHDAVVAPQTLHITLREQIR
jgi:hypothetical protein